MSKNKELSQDYFDRHPNSEQCHITSDGRVFHSRGTATGYASSLEDDTVYSFNRDGKKVQDIEVVNAQLQETPADETPGDETQSDETPADETPADETPGDETPTDESPANETGAITLAAFDEETTTYEQGKALLAALNLKAKSNKKVDIFAVLTAAKEAAQN
jgi:hypothetical protein